MYEPADFYLTAVDQPREAVERSDIKGKLSSCIYVAILGLVFLLPGPKDMLCINTFLIVCGTYLVIHGMYYFFADRM